MDIHYFEHIWTEEKNSGTAEESYWDNRAEEFNKSAYSGGSNNRISNIFEFLTNNGMLDRGSSVLDIGCGPGRFANKFAQVAGTVKGIDISGRMLDFAANNAEANNLTNVSYEKMDWGQANLDGMGWNRKYDLVTAINCPGINNKATLDKMVAASRKYCFLSHFVQRTDSVKDFIVSDILKLDGNTFKKDRIYSIFNILWLSGYYPGIVYHDSEQERVRPVNEAYDYYCSLIKTEKSLSNSQMNSIRDYIIKSSEDGLVKEIIKSKTAWLFWKV